MTYLFLDTSTPQCTVTITDVEGEQFVHEWQADRSLAKGLLRYLTDILSEHGLDFTSIEGIGVYRGPGSFTGLRIGLTVLNTIADTYAIPIIGATGEDWQSVVLERLRHGEDDRIVMPLYGADARITTPRK